MQGILGNNYDIIEEGLNSRTIISEDPRPLKERRNGNTYLIPCLDSHDPLDLVIVMLGTNELKHAYNNSPEKIRNTLEKYIIKIILSRKSQFQNKYPELLIIAPPIIDETTTWASIQYTGGTNKSKQLSKIYSHIAKRNNCLFLDASNLKVGSDGVHMTKESHLKLVTQLSQKIKSSVK